MPACRHAKRGHVEKLHCECAEVCISEALHDYINKLLEHTDDIADNGSNEPDVHRNSPAMVYCNMRAYCCVHTLAAILVILISRPI